ncbi:MAG: transglycosylase SLT domain-containing protein [Nitrospirae bacterium]|nr:transglycosylase SLT domain-containing protein [Nitrospirota bacterium]MBF0535431.1 transglycosylase SLT domain-containing protein [Nitrospirota bacterium]MBF0617619.1 transglycosylase SLT domain-containing protein [Nitrospirota bacterium]
MKKQTMVTFFIMIFSSVLIPTHSNCGAEELYLRQGPTTAATSDSKISSTENIFRLQRSSQFRTPAELRNQVDFWKKIFTSVSNHQAVIHDKRAMGVIYETVELTENESKDKKMRAFAVSPVLRKYKAILERLDAMPPYELERLTGEDKRVYDLLYSNGIRSGYKDAADRLRVQVGQSDRFKKALSRSTLYLKNMEEVFAERGLPTELTRLPFVESAFDINAYSWANAAGLWQFTRYTAKKYVKINKVVDERLDPIKSTTAASKLLAFNYEQLHSWPLAITAYNHGCYGMQRAVERTATTDICYIVDNYDGPAFGFASRNFYTELLAVLEILDEYDKYFSDVVFQHPENYDTLTLTRAIKLNHLIAGTSVTVDDIQRLNPELLNPVLDSKLPLPKYYTLKIPQGAKEHLISSLDSDLQSADRNSDGVDLTERKSVTEKPVKISQDAAPTYKRHVIQKGQTLYAISRLYNITVNDIMKINDLKSPESIKAGQVIKIPAAT